MAIKIIKFSFQHSSRSTLIFPGICSTMIRWMLWCGALNGPIFRTRPICSSDAQLSIMWPNAKYSDSPRTIFFLPLHVWFNTEQVLASQGRAGFPRRERKRCQGKLKNQEDPLKSDFDTRWFPPAYTLEKLMISFYSLAWMTLSASIRLHGRA